MRHAHGAAWEERAGSPVGGGVGVLEVSDVHPTERFVRLSILLLSGTRGAAAQVAWPDVERAATDLRGGASSARASAEVAWIAQPSSAPDGKVALQDLDVGSGEVRLERIEISSHDGVRLRILMADRAVSIDVRRDAIAPAIDALIRSVDAVSS